MKQWGSTNSLQFSNEQYEKEVYYFLIDFMNFDLWLKHYRGNLWLNRIISKIFQTHIIYLIVQIWMCMQPIPHWHCWLQETRAFSNTYLSHFVSIFRENLPWFLLWNKSIFASIHCDKNQVNFSSHFCSLLLFPAYKNEYTNKRSTCIVCNEILNIMIYISVINTLSNIWFHYFMWLNHGHWIKLAVLILGSIERTKGFFRRLSTFHIPKNHYQVNI